MTKAELIEFAKARGREEGRALGEYHGFLRGLGAKRSASWEELDAIYLQERTYGYGWVYEDAYQKGVDEKGDGNDLGS